MNATLASLLLSILLASCVVDASCTRKLDVKRKCLKKCNSNSDCRGRKKKCFCDGDCGMSCVRHNRKCKEVLSILHGAVDVKPYNRFNAKARYSCDEGYTLNGPDVRVCRGDGKWGLTAPSCEIEGKCPPPPHISHAKPDSLPGRKYFNVGDRIYYSCEIGYDPEGFSIIACLDNGLWTKHTIKCNPKACPDPGHIHNGVRQVGDFVYMSKVNFTCNEGYQLHGSQSLKCNSSGKWEGVKPHCLPIKCPLLKNPSNGEVVYWNRNRKYIKKNLISLKYGDKATFNCMRGFEIKGDRERICSANERWSGESARCAIVDCGYPGHVPHGMITSPIKTTFGVKLTFRCANRSTHKGHMAITCQENGRWDHSPPLCLKQCTVPKVRHAKVYTSHNDNVGIVQYFNHDNYVVISCKKGYALENRHKKKSFCNNGNKGIYSSSL
ncbi:DgyrCDS2012 [Dimorphilus gyrociliatus]|uniref:DgyrCDS2012 n=1 Tax=Dimorphilus gyrociliatus TaxID=2664684 RepID=A0A7I8VAT0_9ANNE|nr:DgyrCDS2012 [Dimorphilus gyrociliatus]